MGGFFGLLDERRGSRHHGYVGGRELRHALGVSLELGGILLIAGCDRSEDVEDRNAAAETGSSAARSGPASLDRAPATTSIDQCDPRAR